MIREYSFSGDGTLKFDDSRTVRELIEYAFEEFGYYEPAGMETLTIFQPSHSRTNNGWFTQDTNRRCADEIEKCKHLCFAYQMPGVFYFAEGGWGHHMIELGNHPVIPDPVAIMIRFDDFRNTVVINGNYCFNDIIRYLKKTGYISEDCSRLRVLLVGTGEAYSIPFSDSIMQIPLRYFEEKISEYTDQRYPGHGMVYHEEIEIG